MLLYIHTFVAQTELLLHILKRIDSLQIIPDNKQNK